MIHVPTIPLFPMRWAEQWRPGQVDRWSATKKLLSGIVVCEIEHSLASFTRGQKGRYTTPLQVQVDPPKGYEIVADCARPLPSVWYPMHADMRRFALYPKDKPHLRPEAEALARGVYDKATWRAGRLFYGPCNLPLPDLTPAQTYQAALNVALWLSRLRSIISTPGATGWVEDDQDAILHPLNGWTPPGPLNRGEQAGSGIFFYTGHTQTQDDPAYNWLMACCENQRWWHAFDRATGRVITADDYPDPGPMYQQGTNDKNNGWLPEFMGIASSPEPLPLPYDAAHSIRGFRHLVAVVEQTDSPGARRMLRSLAAQFRLQLSERGQTGPWADSLRKLLWAARNAPHTGTWGQDTGRQLGLVAYIIAQAKKHGATENKNWCTTFAEFAETAAMPTGVVSRCANDAKYPNDVWFDPTHDLAHAFEVPEFWSGAVGASIQGQRPIANAMRFATALYEEAPLLPYYTSGKGPPGYLWVAARGGAPYAKITGGKNGTGDSTHVQVGCALAAHLTPSQRQRWIDAARRIDPNFSDLRKSAGIVAQMQRLQALS